MTISVADDDWSRDDPELAHGFDMHSLLQHGYDLSAANIWQHEIAPCLLCAPLPQDREAALILSDEQLNSGKVAHFVCCGNCGTRGPWGDSESQALVLWNAAYKRLTF